MRCESRFGGFGVTMVVGAALLVLGAVETVRGADPSNTCRSHFAFQRNPGPKYGPPKDHHCELSCPAGGACIEIPSGKAIDPDTGKPIPGLTVFRCGCFPGTVGPACDASAIRGKPKKNEKVGPLLKVVCSGDCPEAEPVCAPSDPEPAPPDDPEAADPESPSPKLDWHRCRCF